MMVETYVEVYEKNDTPLAFELTNEDESPFDLGPFDHLEYFVKVRSDDDDAEAVATYTTVNAGGVTVVDAPTGKLVVLTSATDLDAPGQYRHRLDTIDSTGGRVTRMAGPFIVRNT